MVNSLHRPVYHVLLPGLLDPFPQRSASIPASPLLEKLLSRADRNVAPLDYPATLCKLFGLPSSPEQPLATAALSYHATATGQVTPLPDTYLLHADPIHLRPDQDRLLACDLHHQPLTREEATQFANIFNDHFADTQIEIIIAEPNTWFLAVPQPPALQTQPLSMVLGRNIDHFLPTGPEASLWRARLNEIHMLWYQAEPNIRREAAGQLTVSGIWLSGGGLLPKPTPQRFSQVTGDCLILQGLAHRAAKTGTHNPSTVQLESAPGRAILDADPTAWISALEQLEHTLANLLQHELYLYPCAGQVWHWQPSMRYRWWRRTTSITDWSK